ncbi:MAG: AzlC family ABC transporter permease [Kiritimatiellia bacterium]
MDAAEQPAPRRDFRRGLIDALPIFFGYLAVAFAFGITCRQQGHPFWSPLLMSMTHVSGTGQFAVVNLLEKNGSYFAIVLAVLVFNLRYVLMALAVAQRLPASVGPLKRMLMAMGDTDEIVGVAVKQTRPLTFAYYMGLTVCSWSGWVGGTILGAWDRTSGIMSESFQRSLGLALYAMFLAIILPEARGSRPALLCVGLAAVASVGLRLLPTGLDVGWITLIAGVSSAVVAAVLFPKKVEADHAELV